jgi:hypothetical protein
MNKATLLAAASALVLSAGIASAAPAVTQSAVNMRSGPGTQYPVVATLPGGATVDVGSCSGSWCTVNWNGRDGYVSAGYLQIAGGPGVVAPGYYEEPDYGVYAGSDYYDYGPDFYGPGFYGPFGFRHHHRHFGNWQHGPGRPPVMARPGPQPGFTGPRRNFGINQGAPHMSAPTGLRPSFGGPGAFHGAPSIGAAPHAGPAPGGPAPGGPGRQGR